MNLLKNLLFLAMLSLAVIACNPKPKSKTDASAQFGADPSIVNSTGKENFVEFYDKFMTDSLFQISRVIFPLEGKPKFMEDTATFKEDYFYTLDGWAMHRKIDFKNLPRWKAEWYDYDFIVKEIADNYMDNMFIERRYRCDGGKWFLVYYSDLNKRNRGANEPKFPQ